MNTVPKYALPLVRITLALTVLSLLLVGIDRNFSLAGNRIDAPQPNTLLRVVSTSAAPGSLAVVPVELTAAGHEHALNFSLSFDPALLGDPKITPGDDAPDALLEVDNSQLEQGRVGVRLTLPAGRTFAAGARRLVNVKLAISARAGFATPPLELGDQPTARGLFDLNGEVVIAEFAGGLLATQPGFEADVAPRDTGGNGNLSVADWALVGRFAAALDVPAQGAEFQRADCAPRDGLGDGRVSIADWVQAGRYAAALDPPTPAGGPNLPTVGPTLLNQIGAPEQQARTVRIVPATFARGVANTAVIELNALGGEKALGFSLNFDATQLSFVNAAAGADAQGAALNVNSAQTASGRLGLALSLSGNQVFTAGTRAVVNVTFNVPASSALNTTTISFGDQPITREVVDATANVLPVAFAPGIVTLNPPVGAAPTLTSINPSAVLVGGPDFALTVNGTNFVPGSTVRVGGSDRLTEFVGTTQLRATVIAADIAETDTLSITVRNPEPTPAVSNALNLTINNPGPTLASLSPSSIARNSAGFAMTVNGTGFVPGAIVRFNNVNRLTTFFSATQLTAQIPNTALTTSGSFPVVVLNPEPGGGTSNSLNFTVSDPKPIPRVNTISPTQTQAGGAGFTLTATGTGFHSESVLRWNGQNRATTFVNATQLTAEITAADIANAGTASVTVFSPPPGGGTSAAQIFTIVQPPNPLPVITALTPNPVTAGSGAFSLSIAGTGFVQASVVRLNGQERTTTFVSATEIRAAITAADIANGGTAAIRVFNPTPGGGQSNELTLTINFAPPAITLVSPNSAVVGGPAFTLNVTGTNFAPGSVVRWNGENRSTTVVSVTELTAQIPAADIANVGTATITVFNSAGTSNAVTFTINQATRPIPRITLLNPDAAIAGGAAFTLTVTGTNFVTDSTVRWNGTPRPTTFGNSTQLTAQIPAADIANVGTAAVNVFTPPAGGGESNTLSFAITTPPNPSPAITNINPATAVTGAAGLTLTVNGNGFVPASVVRVVINGNGGNGGNGGSGERPTTFVSANQLTAQLPATDFAAAVNLTITVVNPAPGGGTSNAVTLAVVNPAPTVTSLNPSVVAEGGPSFTLTVTGTNFVQGSQVSVNGATRLTTFFSGTQLTAQIAGSEVATGGSLNIQVINPLPGGGVSNVVVLEIRRRSPIPRITSINPEAATAGGPNFTLIVNGNNFVRGSVVRWNGEDRPTDFGSDTLLVAQIPASDIATGGAATVTVFNPAPGGGTSNTTQFRINNPVPRITGISPDAATAGRAGFELVINGGNFTLGSVVRFNGVELIPSIGTSSQLTVQVPAAAIAVGGVVPVTVVNPAPGGGASNVANFTVNNPAPVITILNPGSAAAGTPAFTLAVVGNGFVPGSTVKWNGADRPTAFVNGSQLNVQVTAADVATPGLANVTVTNPAPGGGTSAAATFAIVDQRNPVPTISQLNPSTANAGGAAFTLTVTGADFVAGSTVQVHGSARATVYLSATQLAAQLTAADIASPGLAQITVFNPAPGGGTSNALPLTIVIPPNPVPTISGLSPNAALAGSGAITLTVQGLGFFTSPFGGSVVRWRGADRPTTFVSATQLTAQISAADLFAADAVLVTVFNPEPGGGSSNIATFAVSNPVPTLTSANPAVLTAGGGATTVTLNGTGFVSGATVRVNGATRSAAFISAVQMQVFLAEADTASAGTLIINVTNPGPGGGPSNNLSLPINNPVPAPVGLNPFSITSGGGTFSLIVVGSGFVPNSVVRWRGADRATTFINANVISAQIAAEDIATAGSANVTVFNPAPGGGLSDTLVFVIDPPALCQAICFQSPQYYQVNINRLPSGSILIGGVNFNQPISILSNLAEVKRALQGGSAPLQRLNEEFVAAQISAISGGPFGGALFGTLRCYGLLFATVRLGNGAELTPDTTVGELFSQARLAIIDNRADDMLVLAALLDILNGNDPTSRCQSGNGSGGIEGIRE